MFPSFPSDQSAESPYTFRLLYAVSSRYQHYHPSTHSEARHGEATLYLLFEFLKQFLLGNADPISLPRGNTTNLTLLLSVATSLLHQAFSFNIAAIRVTKVMTSINATLSSDAKNTVTKTLKATAQMTKNAIWPSRGMIPMARTATGAAQIKQIIKLNATAATTASVEFGYR